MQAEKQIQTNRHANKQRKTNRQTDIQTLRPSDIHKKTKTNRDRKKQTERDRGRQMLDRDRQRQSIYLSQGWSCLASKKGAFDYEASPPAHQAMEFRITA